MRLIEAERCAPLLAAEGRTFLRAGHGRAWRMDDLHSFTPLRFAVPDAMDHRGVALVVDPDVFARGACAARPGSSGSETEGALGMSSAGPTEAAGLLPASRGAR